MIFCDERFYEYSFYYLLSHGGFVNSGLGWNVDDEAVEAAGDVTDLAGVLLEYESTFRVNF